MFSYGLWFKELIFNCSVLIQKKAVDVVHELKGASIFLVGKQ